MWKRILPIVVVLGVVGLMVYTLIKEGATECRVCMSFNGRRQCATARGPGEEQARTEAQNTACSRIARGMQDSTACTNSDPIEVACRVR